MALSSALYSDGDDPEAAQHKPAMHTSKSDVAFNGLPNQGARIEIMAWVRSRNLVPATVQEQTESGS